MFQLLVAVLLLSAASWSQQTSADTSNLYRLSGIAPAGSTVSSELSKCQVEVNQQREELNTLRLQLAERDLRMRELAAKLEVVTTLAMTTRQSSELPPVLLVPPSTSGAPLFRAPETPDYLKPREPLYCSAFTWGSTTSINCR